MKLSKRLSAVLTMIPWNSSIADIGTDHGYVPIQACASGRSPSAIAVDVVPGPLAAARAHVQAAGLEHRIDCRLGNGLQCLQPHEVNGALFCGMGGPLIIKLLEASPKVWKAFDFVVMQPMSDSYRLRRFLYDSGWHIQDEDIVYEDGHLYELLLAVPGRLEGLWRWQYEIGPINWSKQHPLLPQLIDHKIQKHEAVILGMSKSSADMSDQINIIKQYIKELEERKWLYNCKK
jgi:tRNA (adenine22-N1)-methyltransferase